MNMIDMCNEAFAVLGDKASHLAVAKWVKHRYDSKISDTTYYKARKAYRDKMKSPPTAPVVATPSVELPVAPRPNVSVASSDVTLADLRRVLAFAKELGGIERLSSIVSALAELKNTR